MAPLASTTKVLAFPAPDEAETQALSADITAQLAQLPTAIADVDTCRRAKESLLLLKRAEDKVLLFFKDIKDQAFKAHKAITSKETEQLKPIKDARLKLSQLIYRFEVDEDRRRREAERQAAEDERKRREAAALEEAQELQAHGATEMAEQVLEQAIAAPAPVVTLPSTATKVQGVSSIANWQWRFTGCPTGVQWDELDGESRQRLLALLPKEYLRPDDKAITKVVKALKASTTIPGVEAFDAGTVMVRG